MSNETLFKNNHEVETLKNYLYKNRLAEDEIDRRLTDFGEYFYKEGFDHGCVVQRNVRKKIESAQAKCRNDAFARIFEVIDDEHSQLILNKKK